MNIAICDDTSADLKLTLQYVKAYCENNNFMVSIDTFACMEDLLDAFKTCVYNILFLDILMEGKNGIEAAQEIRKGNENCNIVFLTSSSSHSLEAYAVDGLAYILKPLDATKLYRVMDRCKSVMLENSRYITVPISRYSTVKVPIGTLCYVEVFEKKVYFQTEETRIITSRMTLDEVAAEIHSNAFYRCHRGYLVNLNYVESFQKGLVKMKNGSELYISARKYTDMQAAYGVYLTQRLRGEIL